MTKTALVLTLSVLTLGLNVVASAYSQTSKDNLVQKIAAIDPSPIVLDNSQGSPLIVDRAIAKQISGDDYAILVGNSPKCSMESTFPEVTVVNRSGRTITSFALLVQSSLEPKTYVLIKHDLSLIPFSSYQVESNHWVKAEKVWVQSTNGFSSTLKQPGPDSQKFWIPGRCTDLKVTVGMIKFDDGTKWTIPSGTGW